MPEEAATDPNTVVLSRELYNLIVGGSAVPVLLFLIWLSWMLINRYMSPERRQERRNREIRMAVAAREERAAKAAMAKEASEGSKPTS